MRILLISMPDTLYVFHWAQARMPNLGISSISGNLDRRSHPVRLLDLVVEPHGIRATVERAVRDIRPHVVGLSAMTFQYGTAGRIARLVKSIDPSIRTVLGGYHATLAYDEIGSDADGRCIDYIVRGEGEATMRDLVEALESGGRGFERIPGLSFWADGALVHNPTRPLLDPADIALPDRESRLLGYRTGWNGLIDAVETSRGCRMECSFCSILQMYGRSYRAFAVERVVEDIRRVKGLGGRRIFFADDNVTLDPSRFLQLCQGIIDNGLNDIRYSTQASSAGIAMSEELVRLMKAANFTLVFLGIESIDDKGLEFLNKGRIADRSVRAIELLRRHDIAVAGGFITGLPDDTPGHVRRTYRFAREHKIAMPLMWCSTPYPKTKLREDLLREGLVDNRNDYRRYNGMYTNVRTRHMSRRRLSFERTCGYLFWLFRTAVLGDNYYLSRDRGTPWTLRASYRLGTYKLFLRGFLGTWQSTHSCTFYSWREYPLVLLREAAGRLSRLFPPGNRAPVNASRPAQPAPREPDPGLKPAD